MLSEKRRLRRRWTDWAVSIASVALVAFWLFLISAPLIIVLPTLGFLVLDLSTDQRDAVILVSQVATLVGCIGFARRVTGGLRRNLRMTIPMLSQLTVVLAASVIIPSVFYNIDIIFHPYGFREHLLGAASAFLQFIGQPSIQHAAAGLLGPGVRLLSLSVTGLAIWGLRSCLKSH